MINRISQLLDRCSGKDSVMPPTKMYNEGWLLRLALDWYSEQPYSKSPFSFAPGARWYSEGLLAPPFLARKRGDLQAEGYTRADGVIGHFSVQPGKRSRIDLLPDATQMVVVEAKMGSPLSAGTTNAPGYDQAARNAACLAHLIGCSGVEASSLSNIALYVIAPESQVKAGIFGNLVNKHSITQKVGDRVARYQGEKDQWFNDIFLPLLKVMSIELITWEQIIHDMRSSDFSDSCQLFYERCSSFVPKLNRRK